VSGRAGRGYAGGGEGGPYNFEVASPWLFAVLGRAMLMSGVKSAVVMTSSQMVQTPLGVGREKLGALAGLMPQAMQLSATGVEGDGSEAEGEEGAVSEAISDEAMRAEREEEERVGSGGSTRGVWAKYRGA
jgi:hypothetical protein